MPTPFYHLSIASELLKRPELTAQARQIIEPQYCPFAFGNTAPDVQVVSGQSREATHFFDLPIRQGDLPAWEAMLQAYPQLTDISHLPAAQTAFLAGYLCHLQADWLWVKQIFAPIFGPDAGWGTFRNRLYLHNVLRSYMDLQVLQHLPEQFGFCLDEVKPDHWLPIVQDQYLVEWSEIVYRQLQPGETAQTVEVFAQRQGIPPEEYYRILQSEERMDEEVFQYVPRAKIDRFREELLEENILLVNNYLISDPTFL